MKENHSALDILFELKNMRERETEREIERERETERERENVMRAKTRNIGTEKKIRK